MSQYDVIIVGAGMTGAALAFEVSKSATVLLLEREDQPGYHATGRSAAAFIPSYGHDNLALRKLTSASFSFLQSPPSGFCSQPLLTPRGLLTIDPEEDPSAISTEFTLLNSVFPDTKLIHEEQIRALVPLLKPDYLNTAIFESNVYDIDVDALHQGYLSGLRAHGGVCICRAEVVGLQRKGSRWRVETIKGEYIGSRFVNAAGAWVDELAQLAETRTLGFTPQRRTAVLLHPPSGVDVSSWPLVTSTTENFYFKPDAGLIMISPADEHPSAPTDAQPEEIDIAYAAHYGEKALGIGTTNIKHSWAGLRTFSGDRTPVIGYDTQTEDFFWAGGQGGHGIQTAPASARLAAQLLLGQSLPGDLERTEFDTRWVSPARFSTPSDINTPT